MIQSNLIYSPVDGVVAQQAHGETVLLRLSDGGYYSLDEVGSIVWERCDGATTVDTIVEAICVDFDVDRITVSVDVDELIAELVEEKLLRRVQQAP